MAWHILFKKNWSDSTCQVFLGLYFKNFWIVFSILLIELILISAKLKAITFAFSSKMILMQEFVLKTQWKAIRWPRGDSPTLKLRKLAKISNFFIGVFLLDVDTMFQSNCIKFTWTKNEIRYSLIGIKIISVVVDAVTAKSATPFLKFRSKFLQTV